jgi:hypothetical protein
MRASPCRPWSRLLIRVTTILLCAIPPAQAQFASTLRLSNPNGRAVLELRKGTQPANPRLLFTAAITAGPTGGTTSLLLQQAFIGDIFNPAAPAAGWTTVRSSITAFSLGGGCGRNNLIDFPYINNNRPEILRITGTTQQVITLGIAGNDQYDSIDCIVQADNRVLYMLTNRTRKRLEFRREQGGLLQLVRDNFGNVITPFVGGMRPSLARFPRVIASPSPLHEQGVAASKGSISVLLENDFVAFFLEAGLVPETQIYKIIAILDDEPLTTFSQCNGPTSPAAAGFSIPKESAVASGVAVGPSRNDNVLWGDYFVAQKGGCTQLQAPEAFGATGPFGLYTWAGVVASQPPVTNEHVWASQYTVLLTPAAVTTFDNGTRRSYVNPFAGRGGPVTGCAMTGSEFDVVEMAIGPGPTNTQVQHSLIPTDAEETIFGSSLEEVWDAASRCE